MPNTGPLGRHASFGENSNGCLLHHCAGWAHAASGSRPPDAIGINSQPGDSASPGAPSGTRRLPGRYVSPAAARRLLIGHAVSDTGARRHAPLRPNPRRKYRRDAKKTAPGELSHRRGRIEPVTLHGNRLYLELRHAFVAGNESFAHRSPRLAPANPGLGEALQQALQGRQKIRPLIRGCLPVAGPPDGSRKTNHSPETYWLSRQAPVPWAYPPPRVLREVRVPAGGRHLPGPELTRGAAEESRRVSVLNELRRSRGKGSPDTSLG